MGLSATSVRASAVCRRRSGPRDRRKGLIDSREIILQNIRYWLDKPGWSEERLGKAIGRSRTAINAWFNEGAAPKTKDLGKIAHAFGIAPHELLAVTPGKPVPLLPRPDEPEPQISSEIALRALARNMGYDLVKRPAGKT